VRNQGQVILNER